MLTTLLKWLYTSVLLIYSLRMVFFYCPSCSMFTLNGGFHVIHVQCSLNMVAVHVSLAQCSLKMVVFHASLVQCTLRMVALYSSFAQRSVTLRIHNQVFVFVFIFRFRIRIQNDFASQSYSLE